MKKNLVFLVTICVLFSCSTPADTKEAATTFNIDSVKAAIEANNKVFIDAVKNHDSAAFVATYTADACILPQGAGRMCGSKEIGAFYSMTQSMGITGMAATIIEVTGGKELVSEEATYELMGPDGKVMEKGKYLVTWKQENGVWKKYRDIWNSDAQPQAPEKK